MLKKLPKSAQNHLKNKQIILIIYKYLKVDYE